MVARNCMRQLLSVMLAVSLLGGTVAFAAPSDGSSPNLTVGEFVLLYAKAARIELPPGISVKTAVSALQAARLLPALEGTLDRALTHADLVRIGKAAGMRVTSRTPDKRIERTEADQFLRLFFEMQ